MSEKTNTLNPSEQSDERVDNLFRIFDSAGNSVSEGARLVEKAKAYLDQVYLDGFQEGIEVSLNVKIL